MWAVPQLWDVSQVDVCYANHIITTKVVPVTQCKLDTLTDHLPVESRADNWDHEGFLPDRVLHDA
jgi:hypothetical protein